MEKYRDALRDIIDSEDPSLRAAHHLVLSYCVCDVGVQDCPVHIRRMLDKEQKIAFRKAWDARVEESA